MPSPRYRSRSMIRRKVRTPGGKLVTHYSRRKANKPVCASCGAHLPGSWSQSTSNLKSKTQRRPERPYGGYLCSKCLKLFYKSSVRGSE
ncbi:MAG: 50S ribosomal protein L34e [Candidatus Jordarchaeum sp.]|uniref:50S ribosomal protein L34e n=1 Tax=Candidatus Jordarchaeum sp. TaxID=2823881 RepID=UPI00404993AC